MAPITFSSTQPDPMLQHEIRQRAYDLYERRGAVGDHALDDWLQAESEVLREKRAVNFSRTNEPTR
jgi:outer membrane protein TolC